MMEVLRASRDHSEAMVAQLHARLRQALQEVEALKKQVEPQPKKAE